LIVTFDVFPPELAVIVAEPILVAVAVAVKTPPALV